MATSTIQTNLLTHNGDYPNGTALADVRNGFYRVLASAAPAEGLPSGFGYCTLFKWTQNTGYIMAILTDIYGKLAVWSTQNNEWVVH